MVVVNYLLFESAVGFSVFEVVHQADTVGLELPEVKDAMKTLDKFGKMIQLRSFNPWTYVSHESPRPPHWRTMAEACVHSESTTD
jgi:nucleolar protein 56